MSHDPLGPFRLATLLFSSVRNWWRKSLSGSWPMAQGTIENWCQDEAGDDFGYYILYSYPAAESFYSGKFHADVCDDEIFQEVFRGQPIMVRYNPEHPEISVFRETDNAQFLDEVV